MKLEILKRMSICEKCPKMLTTRMCEICACPIDDKTKKENESCPNGLW